MESTIAVRRPARGLRLFPGSTSGLRAISEQVLPPSRDFSTDSFAYFPGAPASSALLIRTSVTRLEGIHPSE